MILNFPNTTTHIESDYLIGIPIERMAVIHAGVEQRSIGNVSSYDISIGRINFENDLTDSDYPTIVII